MFIFEREAKSTSGGGAEREGDTQSDSTEHDAGLKPTNHGIMT